MTLNELKYIATLAKEKHFRKASEKCFVSQPTLSIAIKKLEQELNTTLFERKKNEVIVTPIGQTIVSLANSILRQTDEIKQIAQTQNNSLSVLKIGAIYTIGPYLLPKIIAKFKQLFPETHLIVEESYTHVLGEKLKSGELDIIFISYPFEEPNIETYPIYTEPFVAALPNTHALNKQSVIELNKIENETVLLLGAGHCFRDQVTQAYPNLLNMNNQTENWQKTLEGSSLETIRYMVASGAGITVLPYSSVLNQNTDLLCIKPLKAPIPNRIVAMAWRKTFPQPQLIEKIKTLLTKIPLEWTS